MSTNSQTFDLRDIRATDSNSLLRLYDVARARLDHPQSEQDRVRADKALQRIINELRKRQISF